jgi:DNA-binding transcriptional ArsR family regulator
MLTELFTSKTRIKLLLKLFLNPHVSCYLRELSAEFAVSPNAIKGELDSLSNAGYLEREQNGRSIFFRANKKHPFFPEIHSIVRKTFGIDQLLDEIITSLGTVEAAFILDDYAQGRDSGIIDLLLIGNINRKRLDELREITEGKIKRKIRTISVAAEEFEESKDIYLSRPHWQII